MQIVVEYVFVENFLIGLIILKTVGMILREKGRWFFLSAALGACLTVVMPALYLSSLGWLFVEAGQAVLCVCISFKFKKIQKFFQIFCTYFAATFLYGGACYFFEELLGQKSFLLILGVIVGVFVVVKVVAKTYARKKAVDEFCFDVKIETDGRSGTWRAFLDSGNLLFDPVTDSPVCLINFRVFAALYNDIDLEDIIRRSEKLKMLKFAHYINFNTLGSENKILVFQVDRLVLEGQPHEKVTLGLCLKNFDDAFGSDIILHNNFVCAK